jgi:hypothetical protein
VEVHFTVGHFRIDGKRGDAGDCFLNFVASSYPGSVAQVGLGIEMIPRLQRSRIRVPKTWAVGPRFYIARLRRFPFLEPVRQFLLPPDLSFIAS